MKKIVYVERYFFEWVSIEKVFRQVAGALDPAEFETTFVKAPYNNSLSGTFRNLLSFRPRGGDLYHVTGHIHYMALVLPPARTVLTIHDLRFLHDKKGIKRFVLKKLFLDLPLRRLKYVTAISEATRREIAELGNVDPGRIRVIENPLREEFVPQKSRAFDRSCPRILQVGTMVNKNIPNLARALRGLPCKLVIVGKLDDATTAVLTSEGIDFENKIDLDDAQLAAEYERCDLVAFCSTYEGFGLPIIEGQAVGRPVITSDRSPMKEVAGSAASFVDPEDVASIRKGIERVISDEDLRNKLIADGFENVKRFRAAAIADEYAQLYRSILG